MIALHIPRRGWFFIATVAVVTAGLGLLAGLQAAGVVDRRGLAAGVGVLMLAMAPLSLPWWRSVGEAAREAHKSAFYWGGMTGLAFIGYVVVTADLSARVSLPAMAALWIDPGPQTAGLAAGGALAVFIITACYAVAWSAWWLRRR